MVRTATLAERFDAALAGEPMREQRSGAPIARASERRTRVSAPGTPVRPSDAEPEASQRYRGGHRLDDRGRGVEALLLRADARRLGVS